MGNLESKDPFVLINIVPPPLRKKLASLKHFCLLFFSHFYHCEWNHLSPLKTTFSLTHTHRFWSQWLRAEISVQVNPCKLRISIPEFITICTIRKRSTSHSCLPMCDQLPFYRRKLILHHFYKYDHVAFMDVAVSGSGTGSRDDIGACDQEITTLVSQAWHHRGWGGGSLKRMKSCQMDELNDNDSRLKFNQSWLFCFVDSSLRGFTQTHTTHTHTPTDVFIRNTFINLVVLSRNFLYSCSISFLDCYGGW